MRRAFFHAGWHPHQFRSHGASSTSSLEKVHFVVEGDSVSKMRKVRGCKPRGLCAPAWMTTSRRLVEEGVSDGIAAPHIIRQTPVGFVSVVDIVVVGGALSTRWRRSRRAAKRLDVRSSRMAMVGHRGQMRSEARVERFAANARHVLARGVTINT